MENPENKSEKDKWIDEGKRFRDSTLQYLIDNFLVILMIGFGIAVVLGIKQGCNA